MSTNEVRLILDTQPVPRGLLAPARPAMPNVAVVYATGFGEVACFDGRPLRKGQQIMSKYRFRYDVDLSDHRRTARLERTPLPSRDDAYHFDAEVDVGFRAGDPEAIVRRNIGDALPVVYGFLAAQFRLVTRKYDIRRAEDAELEINQWFAQPAALEEGITIYYCRVRLAPDQDARDYLRSLEEVERAKAVGAARHTLDVGTAQHEHVMALMNEQGRQELDRVSARMQPELDAREIARAQHEHVMALMNEQGRQELDQLGARMQPELEAREIARAEHEVRLARIASDARRDEERVEREMLAHLPQNIWGLLLMHLQRHPDETSYVTELYSRHQQAITARHDENDQRSLELVRFMIDRDLLQPVDIAEVRDQAVSRVQQIAAAGHGELPAGGDGWDDLPDGVSQVIRGSSVPQPPPGSPPSAGRVVPVYVLIDESVELPGYLEEVNAGLSAMPAALTQNPDTAGAIRLALLGYAAEVALRIPMTGVTAASLMPALGPRAGCRLGPPLEDLRERLTADIERFKSRDLVVSRPVVIVLSAGPVEDPDAWPAAHRRLTDRTTFRYAPTIVACGVDGADPAVVARLATQPGQAFVAAPGVPTEYSVRAFTDFVARFIAHFAAESLTGAGRAVVDRPAGFVPAAGPPQSGPYPAADPGFDPYQSYQGG